MLPKKTQVYAQFDQRVRCPTEKKLKPDLGLFYSQINYIVAFYLSINSKKCILHVDNNSTDQSSQTHRQIVAFSVEIIPKTHFVFNPLIPSRLVRLESLD